MCLGSDKLLLGPLIDFHTRSIRANCVGMLARWSWGRSQNKYGGMRCHGREVPVLEVATASFVGSLDGVARQVITEGDGSPLVEEELHR